MRVRTPGAASRCMSKCCASAPIQMILVMLAGRVNEEQRAVIGYLKEENRSCASCAEQASALHR